MWELTAFPHILQLEFRGLYINGRKGSERRMKRGKDGKGRKETGWEGREKKKTGEG